MRKSFNTQQATVNVVVFLVLILCASCGANKEPQVQTTTDSPQIFNTPQKVIPHSEWSEAVLYFAIVDRFADGDPTTNVKVDPLDKGAFHGGDLRGLIDNLDEISSLGITALWITPVVKNIPNFVSGAGFPDWAYHGYWGDDFYSLDSRFGTEAELKELADACHERGMALLLDVVYNHAGYSTSYLDDPVKKTWLRNPALKQGGTDDITNCIAGLPDWRTELPEVREFLFEAHMGLAERVGLDGFRLDTVKHVTHDFWQEHRTLVDERLGKDFFLVGEVWGGNVKSLDPWFENDEMDSGFDFSFQGSVVGFLLGRGRPVAFNRYLEKRENIREGYSVSHYLSSHDTNGALNLLDGDREAFRLAVVMQMTCSGIPCVYYGEEVGRYGGDWPANRSNMPWGNKGILPSSDEPRDTDLQSFYKQLIQLRREHPALWRGEHKGLAFDKHLLVYGRQDIVTDDAVAVAINRDDTEIEATFDAPVSPGATQVVDYLTGTSYPVTDGQVTVLIAGRTAMILGTESKK